MSLWKQQQQQQHCLRMFEKILQWTGIQSAYLHDLVPRDASGPRRYLQKFQKCYIICEIIHEIYYFRPPRSSCKCFLLLITDVAGI